MSTWSKLQQVQSAHGLQCDAWEKRPCGLWILQSSGSTNFAWCKVRIRTSTEIIRFINTDQKWISSCLQCSSEAKAKYKISYQGCFWKLVSHRCLRCRWCTVPYAGYAFGSSSYPYRHAYAERRKPRDQKYASKTVHAGKAHILSQFDSSSPSWCHSRP